MALKKSDSTFRFRPLPCFNTLRSPHHFQYFGGGQVSVTHGDASHCCPGEFDESGPGHGIIARHDRNPFITNPNLIFPGDTLGLPGKEIAPAPVAEAPKPEPLKEAPKEEAKGHYRKPAGAWVRARVGRAPDASPGRSGRCRAGRPMLGLWSSCGERARS